MGPPEHSHCMLLTQRPLWPSQGGAPTPALCQAGAVQPAGGHWCVHGGGEHAERQPVASSGLMPGVACSVFGAPAAASMWSGEALKAQAPDPRRGCGKRCVLRVASQSDGEAAS